MQHCASCRPSTHSSLLYEKCLYRYLNCNSRVWVIRPNGSLVHFEHLQSDKRGDDLLQLGVYQLDKRAKLRLCMDTLRDEHTRSRSDSLYPSSKNPRTRGGRESRDCNSLRTEHIPSTVPDSVMRRSGVRSLLRAILYKKGGS